MFNEKNYTNPIFPPNKGDYSIAYLCNVESKQITKISLSTRPSLMHGNKVGSKVSYEGEDFVLISVETDTEAFNKHVKDYRDMEAKLHEKFLKDVLAEYDLPDNSFTRHLYSRAYASGHSGGRQQVWNDMSDYAEIYEEARAFFTKD